ncbi:glycoside hydrolase family 6 protein [Streptomyces sp. WAC06614]|uniref:glycoside hydrolase family 6 protein n=1 Tax=Streptomyces sp. WAC06614 TaxID=2487416 RepID=UPI0021AF6D62|nr:glycoside hydrolase family 6 protein [Streptomyces sp. WAC06614]
MRAPGPRPWRLLVPAAVLLALTACSAAPGPPAPPRGGAAAAAADPAAAAPEAPFWVDPAGPAARQVAAWEDQGRTGDAQVLRRISERPTALWAPAGDPGPEVRRAVRGAAAAKRTVVLTVHQLPHRDCGARPRTGGAADAAAYRRWLDAFADAVGDARALVVLEPGAVPQLLSDGCLTPGRREERVRLLSAAVDRLGRNRNTKVYLDAGDPAPGRDVKELAAALERAGLARADGFALNVRGFRTDTEAREFGTRLSKATGGRHYVVDTGRNGAGPLPGDPARTSCNPPGRALGTPPTDRTGDPLADAYLWIAHPGDSDGPCHGGPPTGTFWPSYALGLARRTPH